MLSFQRYLLKDAARILAVILGTLAVLSLLAQGLSYIEIIQENRQSVSVYLKIILLSAPKIVALLLPLALFIACLWSLNRLHKDAEISVVQATGMTNWQIASPFFRLATCVVAIHLALNLWGQPAAQRELRESLIDARTNLAASLILPGEFTTTDALTLYARKRTGPDFFDVLITDARIPDQPVDHLAQSGTLLTIEGKPAFVLKDVQIHQLDENGTFSILDLDQYIFDLASLVGEDSDTVYKSTDRYLPELIWLDPTNYVDAKSRTEFTAELHYRLTSPLINIAVILFALWAILGGDYSKLGYGKRIRTASVLVGLMFILHIVAHSESENEAAVNILQWLIPLSAIIILTLKYFAGISVTPLAYLNRRLRRHKAQAQGSNA